ncbi:hypothetical protein [Rhodococcus sp. T7]|uniref:hypothetical protein n=1 Tax=Rhodococcus sp. T7 TaxID=627444 RepID=UPI0013C82131|nr:hypothetical protein [Rhodococcus sp. T7]KAF0959902.1 hypothetical protein MLGJGCBP_07037 [Rhodococcus sp. T7]
MAWRRHSWPAIAEMGLATYLAFVVLFPLLWLGLLTGDGLTLAGHVLMLPVSSTLTAVLDVSATGVGTDGQH